jgi:O-antigen ligase
LVALITSFSILPFAYIHKIRPLRIRTSYCIFLAYFFLLILPSLWLKKDFIIVDLLRKTPDLTGRSHTWELLREKIFERPLLGYGQGAFWHNKDLSHEITSQLGRQVPQLYNSHSSYYDCLLNLGLIGFSILLIILFIKTKSSMALLLRNQKLESQWCVQIIIFCIVGGYSDVGYFIFPRAMGWFAISIVSLMSIQNLKDLDSNETILSDNPYLLKKKFRYRCAKSLSKPIQDFRIFFAKT